MTDQQVPPEKADTIALVTLFSWLSAYALWIAELFVFVKPSVAIFASMEIDLPTITELNLHLAQRLTAPEPLAWMGVLAAPTVSVVAFLSGARGRRARPFYVVLLVLAVALATLSKLAVVVPVAKLQQSLEGK